METNKENSIADNDARIEFRKKMRIRGEEATRTVFKTVKGALRESKKYPNEEIRDR